MGMLSAPHGRRRAALAVALAVGVLLLGILARPTPPTLATTVTGDPALAARVRPLLTGARDRVSVIVVDGDAVTYAHFGANADTEYELGSIAKTFTAALLADAIARGEVRADTPLGALLPLAGSPVAEVTLVELASHRAGLPRLATRPQDIASTAARALGHKDPYTEDLATLLAQARAATLHERGQTAYSNLGVALLGQALAAASGLAYPELVRERLLLPLGLTATSVPVTAANLPPGAPTGYSATGYPEAPWTLNAYAPAGGVRSTPADMARYARALLAGTAPGADALTPRWAYGPRQIGYAWLTETDNGRTVTWHDGETGGFTSMIALDRAAGRAVIILSDTGAPVADAALALLTGGGLMGRRSLLVLAVLLGTTAHFALGAWRARGIGSSRDRWSLFGGVATACTALVLGALLVDWAAVPGVVWLVAVGLVAVGVGGAAWRWATLPWSAANARWRATHWPRQRPGARRLAARPGPRLMLDSGAKPRRDKTRQDFLALRHVGPELENMRPGAK